MFIPEPVIKVAVNADRTQCRAKNWAKRCNGSARKTRRFQCHDRRRDRPKSLSPAWVNCTSTFMSNEFDANTTSKSKSVLRKSATGKRRRQNSRIRLQTQETVGWFRSVRSYQGLHGTVRREELEEGVEAKDGFIFEESIVSGRIPKQYIPAVEQGMREIAVDKGTLAEYPVVGLRMFARKTVPTTTSIVRKWRSRPVPADMFREFMPKTKPSVAGTGHDLRNRNARTIPGWHRR